MKKFILLLLLMLATPLMASRQFSREFLIEVQKGNVAGHSIVHKFGRNSIVNGTEGIWQIGGPFTFLTTATTVRVPVFRCHSESLNIETEKNISANDVRAVLSAAPGVIVYDAPEKNIYPLQTICADKDEVYVNGVESDGNDGYYVTDWMTGKLYQIDKAGNATLLLELEQGMADHEVILEKNLILLPMMKNDKLLAYKIKK